MGFSTPERSEPPGARSASSTYPRAARSAEIMEGGPGETIFRVVCKLRRRYAAAYGAPALRSL